MGFSQSDRQVLATLAARVNEVGHLPVQSQTRELWRKLNGLEPCRPLVWINEWPVDELREDPELDLQCEDPFCRDLEWQLRFTLYCWDHMRVDMVVDPVVHVKYVLGDTKYGLDVEGARSGGSDYGRGSHDYEPILKTEDDIARIEPPVITLDREATERNYQATCDLVGDHIEVVTDGIFHMWCAPWDVLIQWYGITELYMDMMDRPDFVHKAISHMTDCLLARLDQYEQLGVLSAGNGNHRVGSGGLGITDRLPQPDYTGDPARPIDQWGTSTGQIFSEVSPAMHEEFSLQYERKWLERFGLNCYGCCEPLHNKMDILATIPRLRRVSMSPWIDLEKAVEAVGTDYVFSSKPNPAIFSPDRFSPEQARKDLARVLEATRGLHVELVMKDITTCRHDPKRIWHWCDIVMEMVRDYA